MKSAAYILIALSLAGTTAAGQSIRLRTVALASGTQVRLAEVAMVTGLDAKVGQTVVLDGVNGTSRRLSLDEVQLALQTAGVDVIPIRFIGAANCEVRRIQPTASRNSEPTSAPATQPAIVSITTAATTAAAVAEVATTMVAIDPQGTLGERVLVQLAQQLGVDAQQITLEFERNSQETSGMTPAGIANITSTDRQRVGRRRWRVDLTQDGRRYQRYLAGTVSVKRQTVIASRDVAAGAVIGADDVKTILRNDDGFQQVMADVASVVGQEAQRAIAAGQPVQATDLKAPLLVHRGQATGVYYQAGRLTVKLSAQALSDGRQGDRVQFENSANRSRLWAVVTGPDRAEVLALAPVRENR